MNLDHVRLFTKVVRLGGFSRAARALSMPKSTVSRRIGELEEALGVRLLHRTTRKLSLTDAGRLYFARTERIVEELEAADRAVVELQSEARGTLRLTAPSDMADSMLTPVLDRFLQRHPRVKLVVLATNRRVDLVGEGVDLALRAGPLSDSTLVARRLSVPPLRLYAAPQYLERRGTPEDPAALSNHDCLVFSADSNEATWRLWGPSGMVAVRVGGALAASEFGVLESACAAGMGIALLPNVNVWQQEQNGRLTRVLPDHRGPESVLHAVFPSASHLTPKVRAFIDFFVEYLDGCTASP